jgi:hypothetical protein
MAENKEFDNDWLDIQIPDEELFNPMDFIYSDPDPEEVMKKLYILMSMPDYFRFVTKYILNVDLLPFQLVVLKELWDKKFPMLIACRGASKSFMMSVYAILRALLLPKRKIVIVGAAFRQSKFLFAYMQNIWDNAPVLRDLLQGSGSGCFGGVDRCTVRIGTSTITCLPLGSGDTIRGERAHDIISDEFSSIPIDVLETVVFGFGVVSSSPVDKVKRKRREKLGLIDKDNSEPGQKENQIVVAGTAYYTFNHFYDYWKKYKSWILTKGDDKKIQEVLGNAENKNFRHNDYTVMRIPVKQLPEGLMDEGMIAKAKASIHTGTFNMEYEAVFSGDSVGFFKRTLIESCTVKHNNPIVLASGEVFFEATLRGDLGKKYVIGVDPASEVDHFAIVVIEINDDHRRIVHVWTTNKQQHKEKIKTGTIEETDFYAYCARKIRNLMKVFPTQEIAIDSQGGGRAIEECLHDKDKIKPGEIPIWPIIDPDKPKDTDDHNGLHILNMVNFAKADWTGAANHGLRKDLEDKVLLFPYYDPISLEMSYQEDAAEGRVYDTLEDCMMDIEELKDELAMIVVTQTPSGRERWDTPDTTAGTGRKGRVRKDRYSALVMANMSARTGFTTSVFDGYSQTGGFAKKSKPEDLEDPKNWYSGPQWFTENYNAFG